MQKKSKAIPRHADLARSTPRQLAWKWFKSLKWHLLFLFLSDYGRDIIERKYDAFTTDRAYENRPSGKWLIGKLVDWIVLQQDTHVGLRQRLAIVIEELSRVILEFRKVGVSPVRVVSGPCGLARDLRLTWARLKEMEDEPGAWLELVGLDLDFSGETLPEAQRLAKADGVHLILFRQDLLDVQGLKARLRGQPVHIFLSIGFVVWLDPPVLAQFLHVVHSLLEPGGLFLVDNFRRHGSSRYMYDFEMKGRYHPEQEFEAQLTGVGFAIEEKWETANRIDILYRARKERRPGGRRI